MISFLKVSCSPSRQGLTRNITDASQVKWKGTSLYDDFFYNIILDLTMLFMRYHNFIFNLIQATLCCFLIRVEILLIIYHKVVRSARIRLRTKISTF